MPAKRDLSRPMRSRASTKFRRRYERLPERIQWLTVKQYQLWLRDLSHPSVEFKKVGRYWSARVTKKYRALGVMSGETVVWF